jgi:hypothetical protein
VVREGFSLEGPGFRASVAARRHIQDPADLLSKFASHTGGDVPRVLAHLVQQPGERYADSDEV